MSSPSLATAKEASRVELKEESTVLYKGQLLEKQKFHLQLEERLILETEIANLMPVNLGKQFENERASSEPSDVLSSPIERAFN